jgi:hypothetical protein
MQSAHACLKTKDLPHAEHRSQTSNTKECPMRRDGSKSGACSCGCTDWWLDRRLRNFGQASSDPWISDCNNGAGYQQANLKTADWQKENQSRQKTSALGRTQVWRRQLAQLPWLVVELQLVGRLAGWRPSLAAIAPWRDYAGVPGRATKRGCGRNQSNNNGLRGAFEATSRISPIKHQATLLKPYIPPRPKTSNQNAPWLCFNFCTRLGI